MGFANFRNFNFFTLELPYLDNRKNISSIHPGLYKAKKYFSPRYKRLVVLLFDVPNRTFIEIHHGNFTHDLLGCIAVGDSVKYLDDDGSPDVTNSVKTLDKLLNLLPDEFEVSIL